jgi:hypothetical protein
MYVLDVLLQQTTCNRQLAAGDGEESGHSKRVIVETTMAFWSLL